MKLTLEQAQAIDYLLQKICASAEYKSYYKRTIRPVICLNNEYWCGTFIYSLEGSQVEEPTVEYGAFPKKVLKPVLSQNTSIAYAYRNFSRDLSFLDFLSSDDAFDLELLYEKLASFISDAEASNNMRPYFYDPSPVSQKGFNALPFIDLSDHNEIELVSIIDLTEQN